MGNVRLIFGGTIKSHTNKHKLETYSNQANELFISIDINEYPEACICLDKSTAIKFSKELRKQISLLED